MLATTLSAIRSHAPCASGWKKLITALGEYGDDTPLPLVRIVETNGVLDALWALRTQPADIAKPVAVQFAIECAERTLPALEAKHPDNKRPRAAIEAARAWLADPSEENERKARQAAAAAYYAAYAAAAYAAANGAYAADAAAAAYAERKWPKARLIELLNGDTQ